MSFETFMPLPDTKIKLYVKNVHMFDPHILCNVLKKIDQNEAIFTVEELEAIYGLIRNQYINITDHDY